MEADFRSAVRAYIRKQANPPDKYSHQERLYELARGLAAGQAFDDDVLFAAAWLHDLGVFVGHRPADAAALATWDHIAYACERAPALLREFGFPESKVPAVLECIRTHMPSNNPTTFEGVLLRDADILEQLGAVGILRTVSKVGRDTRFITFADALRVLRRNAEELPRQLRLDTGRAAAAARLTVLEQFLAAAEAEAAGFDW